MVRTDSFKILGADGVFKVLFTFIDPAGRLQEGQAVLVEKSEMVMIAVLGSGQNIPQFIGGPAGHGKHRNGLTGFGRVFAAIIHQKPGDHAPPVSHSLGRRMFARMLVHEFGERGFAPVIVLVQHVHHGRIAAVPSRFLIGAGHELGTHDIVPHLPAEIKTVPLVLFPAKRLYQVCQFIQPVVQKFHKLPALGVDYGLLNQAPDMLGFAFVFQIDPVEQIFIDAQVIRKVRGVILEFRLDFSVYTAAPVGDSETCFAA